jgi:predicted PurR-regulated permease PerM
VTRLERLALLVFFVLVVAGLATQAAVSTAIGAVAGLAAGLVVAPRVSRLRRRVDARMGADEVARGFRPRRLGVRVVAHLAVLAALLVLTVLIPFIGDELFAGLAAGATALPFVLTGARLRG